MTMITPSYLGETIEYSSLHACRSTLEDPTGVVDAGRGFLNNLPLTSFGTADPNIFKSSLDSATLGLKNAFPKNSRY